MVDSVFDGLATAKKYGNEELWRKHADVFEDLGYVPIGRTRLSPRVEQQIAELIGRGVGETQDDILAAAVSFYNQVKEAPPNFDLHSDHQSDEFLLSQIGIWLSRNKITIEGPAPTKSVVPKPASLQDTRSVVQLLHYSRLLAECFQEAAEYDPLLHHNRPPPVLWVQNVNYQDDIRQLIQELRRLNQLIEGFNEVPNAARKQTLEFAKHFDRFLESYAKAIGKGLAGLTVGAVVALLYHAGVGQELIDSLWRHLKIPD